MGDELRDVRPEPNKSFAFHDLARRISNWTGNLVATCLVIVVAIGFGRQMMEWSADSAPGASPLSNANDLDFELGLPDSFDILEFGSSRDTFHRQTIQTDKANAQSRLRDLTRVATLTATLPSKTISAAENKLIEQIKDVAPTETLTNGRLLYPVPGPIPTWIGAVRMKPVAGAKEKNSAVENEGAAMDSPLRLVTWGMAVPSNKNSWSLYVFILGTMSGATPADDGVLVPPGASRSMGVQGRSGAKMIGFSGKGDPEEWREYFDRELASRSWTPAKAWQEVAGGWNARYRRPLAEGTGEQSMNVRFSQGPNGLYYGMINLSSVRASGKGGSRP